MLNPLAIVELDEFPPNVQRESMFSTMFSSSGVWFIGLEKTLI
jgi:hypothetical protein